MVKFFAFFCTTILRIMIVVPVFLFIANYTEAKNQPVDNITDYHLQERFKESYSTPSQDTKAPGIIQNIKKINNSNNNYDAKVSVKGKAKGKGEKNKATVSSYDRYQITDVNNNSTPIPKPLNFNETVIKNNYPSSDDANKQIYNSEDLNQFTTVSHSVEKISTISNDSLTQTRTMSLISSCGTNHSDSVDKITREGLTLMNLNGPVISQDAESLQDDDLTNSKHIRVKRDFRGDNKIGKIQDEDFLSQEKNLFNDDDRSNIKNELADVYPDLIDDPLNINSAVGLVRKKRLNYEMLFPRSFSKSDYDTQKQTKESNGEMKYSDPKYISSSPVFFESFSKSENMPLKVMNSKVSAEVEKESLNFLDSVRNLTTVVDNAESNYSENNSPIDLRSGETLNSDKAEIGKRYSKRRKKRYAQLRGRMRRRGGPKGGTRKIKHRKKHKKKRKKPKKPTAKTHEERNVLKINEAPMINPNFISELHDEYGESNKRGVSHLVDELQVEAHVAKRDSGDAKSEIDINKREISDNDEGNNEVVLSRDKRTVENIRNSTISEKSNEDDTAVRNSAYGNKEMRYYKDVYEPDLRTKRHYIETKPDLVDKTRKERASKSFRQIKKLMEKLSGKVDELETFVNYDLRERKRSIHEEQKAKVEDLSNLTKSGEEVDFRNQSKDYSDKFETESKLYMENSRRGNEAKAKASGNQKEEKRSTRLLGRRETCKKNRIKMKTHRKWDRWTDWSSCSVTCGKGRQIRWRHCIHDCTLAETEMEEKSCQLPACGPGKFLGIF